MGHLFPVLFAGVVLQDLVGVKWASTDIAAKKKKRLFVGNGRWKVIPEWK
jgi:hypothetical protein